MMYPLLEAVADFLMTNEYKVNLIYAFNGIGKTQLSRIVRNKVTANDQDEEIPSLKKVIYYNAFTEDLFTWDNELLNDAEKVLKIHSDSEYESRYITPEEKQMLVYVFHNFIKNFNWNNCYFIKETEG